MKITKFEKCKKESKFKALFSLEASIPFRITNKENEVINKDMGIIINDLQYFDDGVKQWFVFPRKKRKTEDGKWENLYDFISISDKDFRDCILKTIKDYIQKINLTDKSAIK